MGLFFCALSTPTPKNTVIFLLASLKELNCGQAFNFFSVFCVSKYLIGFPYSYLELAISSDRRVFLRRWLRSARMYWAMLILKGLVPVSFVSSQGRMRFELRFLCSGGWLSIPKVIPLLCKRHFLEEMKWETCKLCNFSHLSPKNLIYVHHILWLFAIPSG
jgi:hypothetical protein